ncbi:MAG: type II toxin-antitoxin system VapB family antitoxin [Methylocystis sp.]|nr:type II toxin-antitoxin system VapB family antitoxin [Methylocystis sp.]
MALYIRDDDVDALAAKVQAATGARTKTEAVRAALEHELERVKAGQSFDERNAEAFALADRIGPPNPDFDEKAFMNEMWGG